MKTMFDTSVLVAAIVSTPQQHAQAAKLLRDAHSGKFPRYIAAYSLAECYATLTAPTRSLGYPPVMVAQIIQENLCQKGATIVGLSAEDYSGPSNLLRHLD